MYLKTDENDNVIEYPYSIAQLKRENPSTSFPQNPSDDVLAGFNVYRVNRETLAATNTQVIDYATTPTKNSDGFWILAGTVRDKTDAEIQRDADAMRRVRDELLAKTDFYALSDVTMSDEMSAYRQALRDITTHENWPYLVGVDEDGNGGDWPVKP